MNKNYIAILTEPYKIEITENPMPIIEDGFVLVEYLYCGICGGDYSSYCGYRQKYPISLGHEFVGRIIDISTTVHNLSIGQYVVSDFNFRCGECVHCLSSQSHLCTKNNIELFTNRGFANYASIQASYLVPIEPPDYLPRACLIEPLSCIIHACQEIKIEDRMHILLCGGGSIGMLFCFYLKNKFQSIDIVAAETNPEKLELLHKHFKAKKYQQNMFFNHDLVIDCSNSVSGLTFSLKHTYPGEKICIMSHLYGHETSFVYEQVCKKELRCVFPLRNGERDNLIAAAQCINDFWTNEYDEMLYVYDDIKKAFKEKSSSSFCKQIINSTTLSIS